MRAELEKQLEEMKKKVSLKKTHHLGIIPF